MPGGDLYGDDWKRLTDSASRVIERFAPGGEWINFVEIGVALSKTSNDMMEFISQRINDKWNYIGIDPIFKPQLGEKYIHIPTPSHIAIQYALLPQKIHWVFVDACHCSQCCMRDAVLYGNILIPAGEISFHDASPLMQGQDPQEWPGTESYHDPAIAREQGVQVRRVLDSGMLAQLRLVLPAQAENQRGGIETFEKM